MKQMSVVKNPTTINGRTLKFGALYGKIDGITYTVERFVEKDAYNNTLMFWVFNGKVWHKVNSLNVGKYGKIVTMCNEYIISHKTWNKQPTDYIRNAEILAVAKDYVRKGKASKPKCQTINTISYCGRF